MAADPFDLGGGLPDFIGETTDAIFRFDDKFTDDDGAPICLLDLTLTNEDGGEEFNKFYTCGPGWEPSEDGKRAVRADDPDDDSANFNGGTKVGRLITSIVTNGGADLIRDRYQNEDIGSTDAAMFLGIRGIWGAIEYAWQYKDKKTGETTKGTSDFTGLKEYQAGDAKPAKAAKKSTAKKATAKKAPAKAKAKPAAEPAPEANGKPSDEMMEAIKAVFDDVETPEQFLERVVDEVDGATDHLEYLTDLHSGAWSDLVDAQA
jgi:hypothetical protein